MVVFIIAFIAAISLGAFRSGGRKTVLDRQAEIVRSALERARMQTLAQKAGSSYGVRFSSSSVVIFPGNAYSEATASNTVFALDPSVTVSALSFSGKDVIFVPFSGAAAPSGTITLSLLGGGGETKSVTVHGTGLAE